MASLFNKTESIVLMLNTRWCHHAAAQQEAANGTAVNGCRKGKNESENKGENTVLWIIPFLRLGSSEQMDPKIPCGVL